MILLERMAATLSESTFSGVMMVPFRLEGRVEGRVVLLPYGSLEMLSRRSVLPVGRGREMLERSGVWLRTVTGVSTAGGLAIGRGDIAGLVGVGRAWA